MVVNKFIIFLCALSPICGINVGDKAQATLQKPEEKVVTTPPVEHHRPVAKLVADKGYPVPQGIRPKFNAMAAEFIAMSLYIFVGCGTLMGVADKDEEGKDKESSAWQLQVALTFALAFVSLSYAISHYSGAQINPAITLALVFTGRIPISQGVLNFIFQLFGCIAGSLLLLLVYPKEQDKTLDLGMNRVKHGWNVWKVLIYETIMSFGLCFVVLETATNPMAWANSAMAPAAIGGIVFLAHAVLLPVDGCSINPARSLGPAVIVKCVKSLQAAGMLTSILEENRFENTETKSDEIKPFEHHWVFWVGPMVGGLVAAGISASFMP